MNNCDNYSDLIGKTFNKLTIKEIVKNKGEKPRAICLCECGNEKNILLRSILSNNTKSCGCYNLELIKLRNTKHNASQRGKRERLYIIWLEMRRRCSSTQNHKRDTYKNYFLKNIKVCQEWQEYSVFKEWALKSGYSNELTIERIDFNKGYFPENCTWIKKGEQSKNRSFCNFLTYKNETKTLTDWAKAFNMKRGALTSRLKRGWSIEKALTTPIKK